MPTEEQRNRKRAWLAQDFIKRKLRIIEYLGGKCVRCGSTERLEPDHIKAREKSFNIGANINRRWEVLVTELDKCQLLCHDCHLIKTKECGETGGGWNKGIRQGEISHGTGTAYTYWKCRCESCKQARYEDRVRYGDLKGTGRRSGKITEHGTGTKGIRGCKCTLCLSVRAKYARDLRYKKI
jgi:hypothetical protein